MKITKLIMAIGALGGAAMAFKKSSDKQRYILHGKRYAEASENAKKAANGRVGVNAPGIKPKKPVKARRIYTTEEQKAELIQNRDNIKYLLYDIQLLVKDKKNGNERRNVKKIYEAWKENLRFREMHALEHKFKALSIECGAADEHADEEAYAELAVKWTEFLELLGLKIDDAERTVITRENRGLYRNGAEFPDNSECVVISRPWFLDGELYCAGKAAYIEPAPASETEPELDARDGDNAERGTDE